MPLLMDSFLQVFHLLFQSLDSPFASAVVVWGTDAPGGEASLVLSKIGDLPELLFVVLLSIDQALESVKAVDFTHL